MDSLPVLRQNIYLVGDVDVQIVGNQLPTNLQVLKVLFFYLRHGSLQLCDSKRRVIQEVLLFWEKGSIPTQVEHRCVQKLDNLYQEWRNLQKNRSRPSNVVKEQDFSSNLNKLFDIAHGFVDHNIDEVKKEFLLDQRNNRRKYIANIETPNSVEQSSREIEKQEKYLQRKRKAEEEQRRLDEITELESGSSGLSALALSHKSAGSNFSASNETEAGPSVAKKSRGTVLVITPKLSAVLDRCKVSDRNAVHLLIATTQALNIDPNDLIINRNSIHSTREKHRRDLAEKIKGIFNGVDLKAVTLHFDGKLLPNLQKHESFERLPVVATANGTEQLLAVPEIDNSMGSTQAKALCEVLIDWNLADKIKALCCDTTAANLGIQKGAAVILEQLLERQLLYFPCRHHIFELVLRSAFEVYIPSVGSPNVSLFKRFRDGWNNLDHAKFTTGIQDGSLKNKLIEHIDAIDLFVQDKLKDRCLRDDYQELLNLTRIVIGKVPPSEAKFRYPGAFHHARWMAKAIYALKMYLFRGQINLKTAEKQGLTAMCHFIVTVYVKAWFMASSAIHASNHDLQFLKVLFEYQSVDKKISDATLGKMLNHLWYLNPQLAATSFFDDQVSVEVKKKMVQKLEVDDESHEKNSKRVNFKKDHLELILNQEMDYFINRESLEFFKIYEINTRFLELDPTLWHLDEYYQNAKKIIMNLRFVNDCAERAVNLVQNFNNLFTHDEEQKQYILQLVASYRKSHPNANKETAVKEIEF